MFNSIKRRRSAPGTIIGSVALLAALGSGAYAAIPAEDGTIQGCYANNNGDLRLSDQACRTKETAIGWNQQGPKGERGEVGPRGESGPPGPAGSSGGQVYLAIGGGSVPYGDPYSSGPVPEAVILSKDVPAGNYVAEVRLYAWHDVPEYQNVSCRMPGEASARVTVPPYSGANGVQPQAFEITSAFTHAGGSVEVKCNRELGRGSAAIENATLLLTKADSVG